MRAPNNDPLVPMHFDKVVEVVEVVEVAKHQKSKGGTISAALLLHSMLDTSTSSEVESLV